MSAFLILAVCLSSDPDICQDQLLPIPVTFMECAMLGERVAQEWLNDHPKWSLKGWRCQIGEEGRRI